MKSKYSRTFSAVVLCGILLSAPIGWSGKVLPLSLKTLTDTAEVIFVGECVAVKSGLDPDSQLMATWYTFRVHQGIKGKLDEKFTLKQYGGSEGNTKVYVPGVQYQVGEQVVLFLYGKSQLGFANAVGMQQGKFVIQTAAKSGVKYVTNGMPTRLLLDGISDTISPQKSSGTKTLSAKPLGTESLELNGFLSTVADLVKEKSKKKE